MPVKILGESLVLYRDRSGGLGLVADRCPHRAAGMVYGVPEQEGLRCAYHGWLFAASGRCLEQPFEETVGNGAFKDKIRIKAYPVEELADMIFAYLGPEPAPLLPRWDLFTRTDVPREIGAGVIPCNWLQIAENALDPVHVEWLHQHFSDYVYEQLGRGERRQLISRKHVRIGFDVFEYGIIKRRLLEGDTEQHERWATGHPLVFPMMLKSGNAAHPVYQMRTPIDDESTLHFWYSAHFGAEGDLLEGVHVDRVPFYEVPIPTLTDKGTPQWDLVDNNSGQDAVMWYTQGAVTDRGVEHLGQSDRGIILFRKLLKENIEKVKRGEDPMNVFRDPAKNVCLELPVEKAKFGQGVYRKGEIRGGNAAKYSPLLREVEEKAPAKALAG